jgi:hypothetical protein
MGIGIPMNNCIVTVPAETSAYVTGRGRQEDTEVKLKLWVHLSARISWGDIDNCANGGLLVIFGQGNSHVLV